jgi:hypothetical protein
MFIATLLMILSASIVYFHVFLNNTIELTVESISLAHIHAMVNDIVEVKTNDFLLSQNELLISENLLVEIQERKNLNFEVLLANDLARFKEISMPLYDLLLHYNKTG